MNHLEFAIMLAALLFGGHSALHRWDARQTRRAMLQRACRVPGQEVRAWVEGLHDEGSAKLWLEFSGRQPHMVAQGRTAVSRAVARLSAAGITVDGGASLTGAGLDPRAGRPPDLPRSRALADISPLARARLFRWRVLSLVRRAGTLARGRKPAG